MNKRKGYIIAILLCILVIGSTIGQVFAVQGRFTGNDVYNTLKNKYEWEYRSKYKLEDYLTKGLVFENRDGKNGFDMSLLIPHTDSFGGVIEGFTTMLDSEDEAIKLFLDLIDGDEDFQDVYGGRKVKVVYNDNNTEVIMYSIKEKNKEK